MLHFKIMTMNDGIIGSQITSGSDQIQRKGTSGTRLGVPLVFGVPAYMVVTELEIAIHIEGAQPGKLLIIDADLLVRVEYYPKNIASAR